MALGTPIALAQKSEVRALALLISGDDSYPTGGSVLDLHDVLVDQVGPINAVLSVTTAIPYPLADRIYSWDGGNKLIATVISTGAQVADTTDLSADTIPLTVIYS